MRKNQNLTEKVTVKFTPDEKAEINQKAEEAGLNRSEYLRQLMLQSEPPMNPIQSPSFRKELLAIGNEIGKLKVKQKTGKRLTSEDYEATEKRIYELCRSLNS